MQNHSDEKSREQRSPTPWLRTLLTVGVAVGLVAVQLAFKQGGTIGTSHAAPAPKSAPSTPTSQSFYATPFEKTPDAATLTTIGRALFSDASLSASGRMSCASCHDPAHAFGPPNGKPVQSGGGDLHRPGMRAVPSLRYAQDTPVFNPHFTETEGDDSIDQGPVGGWTWDGRAASAHEQAAIPLLSPFEMGNASPGAVVARLRLSPTAAAMREAFGAGVLSDERLAWNGLLLALEVFQQSAKDFYPYSSKYDDFLRGKVQLDQSEARGLAIFNDPQRGNCAECHISAIKRGAFPQFTDRGLIALAVPRNMHIAANADAKFFDMGLCGPLRTDLRNVDEYCGLFKTPTLRNVATRKVFFHNGVFHSLEAAVRFYADRDAYPERYYGKAGNLNDLPTKYADNINRDAPFAAQRKRKPSMSNADIRDVVAFLKTLTDKDAKAVQP